MASCRVSVFLLLVWHTRTLGVWIHTKSWGAKRRDDRFCVSLFIDLLPTYSSSFLFIFYPQHLTRGSWVTNVKRGREKQKGGKGEEIKGRKKDISKGTKKKIDKKTDQRWLSSDPRLNFLCVTQKSIPEYGFSRDSSEKPTVQARPALDRGRAGQQPLACNCCLCSVIRNYWAAPSLVKTALF